MQNGKKAGRFGPAFLRYAENVIAPPSRSSEFSVNEAEALFDGDAYAAMTDLLRRAERSVRMEFFLFGGPQADAMINVAAAKQGAGVDVRVTLDRSLGMLPLVRRECRAAYRRLQRLGIDVVLSDARPLPDTPGKAGIAHNKIIVVDEREALVGGMNVGSLFFHHHDVMIRLVGPAARALGEQFDYERQFVVHPQHSRPRNDASPLPRFALPANAAPLPVPCTRARIVGTGVGRRSTRQALLQNLQAVRSSVCVAMCEMGRTDVLDALVAARARGVAVRVLLDPLEMEHYLPPVLGGLRKRAPAGALNAAAIKRLQQAGVPVRLYKTGADFWLMHLKMAVFDNESAVVGSTNWTRGGFEWVGETDVELFGGRVVHQLQDQFERDWQGRSVSAPVPSRGALWVNRLYDRFA